MNKYAPKNINKDLAQELYNSGLSIRKLAKHFNVSQSTISKLGLICRSVEDANRLASKTRVWSEEGLRSLSDHAKKKGLGGYRPHPNKGQKYKGIWFDSKWEVLVAKSLDENNVKWERPTEGLVWTDKGNKYYPDFYLPEYNVYLDPKNDYLRLKDSFKINQASIRNNIRVIVLTENQLGWKSIKDLL